MFDATMAALQKALDLRMRAHEIHASNVANANVPNFKAKSLDFEGRLKEAMFQLEGEGASPMTAREKDASAAISDVEPDIYEDPFAVMNGAGNTVNQQKEQVEIAKNTIAYEAATQLIAKKFALQKYVLGEGGR